MTTTDTTTTERDDFGMHYITEYAPELTTIADNIRRISHGRCYIATAGPQPGFNEPANFWLEFHVDHPGYTSDYQLYIQVTADHADVAVEYGDYTEDEFTLTHTALLEYIMQLPRPIRSYTMDR